MDDRYKFIDEDLETWYCKNDDEFKPNRDEFIIKRFEQEYGRTLKIKIINELVSRSRALKEWFAKISEEYILEVDVPQYFKDKIESRQYRLLSEKVSEFNSQNARESREKQSAAAKYKKEIKQIEEKYAALKLPIIKDDYVRVLTLTKDELPLNLQLLLINYTPEQDSDPRTASLFGREMLVRYKIELLDRISKGEKIGELIEENQTKF